MDRKQQDALLARDRTNAGESRAAKDAEYYNSVRNTGAITPSAVKEGTAEFSAGLADNTPVKFYRIIRYHMSKPAQFRPELRGLTLEQAQAHCQNPATQGKDWFDGYVEDTGT